MVTCHWNGPAALHTQAASCSQNYLPQLIVPPDVKQQADKYSNDRH